MTRLDRRVEQLRVPPCSIEAEQAVLGGVMLTDGEAAKEVGDVVTPADFYRRDHQLIFQAILELADRGNGGVDAVTVGEWFEARGLSEQVAGGAYLIELASTTPSAANIRAYAQIVRDKALLRAGIEVGTQFVNDCFQPEGRDTEEILASAAGAIAAVASRGLQANNGLRLVRGHLKGAWDDLQSRYAGEVQGLLLPWSNTHALVPALEAGDLMYLAARPSMGKTALAMQAACATAQGGRHVAVFSLEMSAGQLSTRLLSHLARVPHDRLRSPKLLEDEDWSRLTAATRILRDLPLAIDDAAGQTVDTLAARAHRMHAKVDGGLGLVVIDYVQLIEAASGSDDKRNDQLTVISRRLKKLAKDLRCPVLALSQLNRGLETRPNKRPVMSDLRESGALEQDGDVIAFIYRDDYYTKEACAAPGVAELIIGKNRNGPTGTAYLAHDLPCSSFDDYQGRPNYTPKGEGDAKAAGGRPRKTRGYTGPADLPEDGSP